MKRMILWIICLMFITGLCSGTVYATPDWPDQVALSAEGGILVDADTGVVIYGKNINETYFPASITKILTALIVIENCDLDEVVTFSRNAVYNVESGSSSAGMDVGDQLTVRDALYVMMLKSANEVANALAEHAAGSMEEFSVMMNDKAARLGCMNSHFVNPSGLNDPNHYTSAYDMALIARAAFQNEIFVEIDSALSYTVPATKRNPEGFTVSPGHKMLKKNSSWYYPGIICGKTGYTSLAGNTLVTCAERDGLRLITVILNGYQTHYEDTKAMLDFGFENFKSVNIAEGDTRYGMVADDLTIAGLPAANLSILSVQKDKKVTLPKNAEFADATSSIAYELPADAPAGAAARISYQYGGHDIGSAYLVVSLAGAAVAPPDTGVMTEAAVTPDAGNDQEPPAEGGNEADIGDSDRPEQRPPLLPIGRKAGFVLAGTAVLAVLAGGIVTMKRIVKKREEADREIRYQRRQQRLKDIGMSASEFELLLQERKSAMGWGDSKKKRRKWFWERF